MQNRSLWPVWIGLLALGTGDSVSAQQADPSPYANEGTRSALVLFARFVDEAPRGVPGWAGELFAAELPGSVAHFYGAMSFGRLRLQGEAAVGEFVVPQAAAAYLAADDTTAGGYGRLVEEVLRQADGAVDFGRFDNDGPDGVADSGDDDGAVDAVFIVLQQVPRRLLRGGATGIRGLGLEEAFASDDLGADGPPIVIRPELGVVLQGRDFTETAAVMCHEYGHILGLPDLFNSEFLQRGGTDPAEDSAGIGAWGLMGLGTLGWNGDDGPNAFSAWSRAELGWAQVVDVEASGLLAVEDVGLRGTVYKVPLTGREYFLLEYRRRSSSYYDRHLPGEGLLVWHVERRLDARRGTGQLLIDLESADGLWADAGFPQGRVEDAADGGDNLDFWAHDAAYARTRGGNSGDATDPFDGRRFTAFTPQTNPASLSNDGTRAIRLDDIRPADDGLLLEVETVPLLAVFSRGRLADASGDRVLVAGEEGRPLFRLYNEGAVPLEGVRVEMSAADALVEVLQAETVFRRIRPGGRTDGAGTSGFPRLRVRPGFTGMLHHSQLVLRAYSGPTLLSERIVPVVAVGHFRSLRSLAVADAAGNGDGRLQAGEDFQLRVELAGVTAGGEAFAYWLRPLDERVQASAGQRLFFAAQSEVGLTPTWRLDDAVAAGTKLRFGLEVRSDFGAWSDTLEVEVAGAGGGSPPAFVLRGNFPNPFNSSTAIVYELSRGGAVELVLFNAAGQPVRRLLEGVEAAGRRQAVWDGRDGHGRPLVSGVYFYRLRSGGQSAVQRLLLLR